MEISPKTPLENLLVMASDVDTIEKLLPKVSPSDLNYICSANKKVEEVCESLNIKKPTWLKKELLGKGAYADVYSLQNIESGKFYAGKFTQGNKKAKEEMAHEVEISQSLSHPNIVKFIGSFSSDICRGDEETLITELSKNGKCDVMVSELCPNGDLLNLLEIRKRITEDEARFFIYQLANALIYLKKMNIAHFDIKLGNVLLDEKLNVKLGDFGLAEFMRSFDQEIKIKGTPNYISPEMLEGNDPTFPADVWAVGVCMYALLIGKPPFETNAVKYTYTRIRDGTFYFPDRVYVSDEAKDLIKKLLTVDPEQRILIEDVIKHDFFTKFSIPESLPINARSETPISIPKNIETPEMTETSDGDLEMNIEQFRNEYKISATTTNNKFYLYLLKKYPKKRMIAWAKFREMFRLL
jgi:serine/threonine protein kinase